MGQRASCPSARIDRILVGKRVFAAQPFLNLSQFLEKLPVQAVAAGARNNGSPSDFFVRHNGERRCEMGAEFLSQCFRYEPNKLGG